MGAHPMRPAPDGETTVDLVFPTDIATVGAAVEAIVAACFPVEPPRPRTHFRMRTVLAEALANAMVYGNGNDPNRQVQVGITFRAEDLVIAVADEGEGFDPCSICCPHDGPTDATTGRGLYLIRQLADAVAFNTRGNIILITLPRS